MENSIQDQTIATLVVGFQAMFSFAPRLCKIFGCKSIKEFWQCMTRPWTVLFSTQSATVMFIIELSSTLVSLLLLIPIWQLSPRSGSTYNIVSIVLSLCRCIVESVYQTWVRVHGASWANPVQVRQLKVSFQNLILPRYSRYVPAAALVFGLVFVPSGAILWKYEAIYATPVITTSSSASLCACTFGFFIVWGERVPGNAKDQMAKQLLLMGITLLAASLSAILSWIYRYEHQSYWVGTHRPEGSIRNADSTAPSSHLCVVRNLEFCFRLAWYFLFSLLKISAQK